MKLTLRQLELQYKAMLPLDKQIYKATGQMRRDLKLVGIDIEVEFKLIQEKKSHLSKSLRDMVEQKYKQLLNAKKVEK